jgi:hypothetical protein
MFGNWIRRLRKTSHTTIHTIQFTICERLENGHYVVHQGLFDTVSKEICDAQKYIVQKVDAELNELREKKARGIV